MLCNFLSATQSSLLVLFAAALFLYKLNNKKFRYWAERGVKFPKPKFILGHSSIIRTKSLLERLKELYDEFPNDRYVGLYQTFKPILLIRDLELIKRITVKDFETFSERRTFVNPENNKLWSNNLFSLNGEKWHDMRTTLSPSFTGSKMKVMFVLMRECAQQFVDYFKDRDQGDTQELEMKDISSKYTNDVIATTAFGIECDSLKHQDNTFYKMGIKATNFGLATLFRIILHALSPFLARVVNLKLIPKDVEEYFTAVIKDTVKVRQEQQIIRPDMIHLLLEAKRNREEKHKTEITIDDIAAQAFIFFFAGFETVSTFLTFTLYELAVNPQIQSKLRQEILAQGDNEEITYEKLLGMKYLDMVVSESLRKWPPMGLVDRRVVKSTTIPAERPWEKPLFLDKGVICMVSVFGIQRDEKYFPEPEKFDPDRFSDERKREMDPFAFLAFGAGPRNCIGMRYALLEGKLLIFKLLKEFEVVLVGRTNVPMVLDKAKFVVSSKGGMWLGFKKIKRSNVDS